MAHKAPKVPLTLSAVLWRVSRLPLLAYLCLNTQKTDGRSEGYHEHDCQDLKWKQLPFWDLP